MDVREYVEKHLAELEHGLDEDGSCLIEIDDDRECVIVQPEGSEMLLFCVNVALVAELDRVGLYEHLLIMNFLDDVTGGAALGLTPDGEVLAVRLTLRATDISGGDIERIVANLGNLAERIAYDLKDRRGAAGAGTAASESEVQVPSTDGPDGGPAKYA